MKRAFPSRDLEISRVYLHSPDRVWKALTDPRKIARWLMPNDFEPRVGHRFTMRTDPAPGFDGVVHCEVLELEEERSMRWSWRGGPIDTQVEFQLSPVFSFGRAGTRLVVRHTGFEGLPAVLVSFILQAGNRRIYGQRLPAVLADGEVADKHANPRRQGWWWIAQIAGPLSARLRRKK